MATHKVLSDLCLVRLRILRDGNKLVSTMTDTGGDIVAAISPPFTSCKTNLLAGRGEGAGPRRRALAPLRTSPERLVRHCTKTWAKCDLPSEHRQRFSWRSWPAPSRRHRLRRPADGEIHTCFAFSTGAARSWATRSPTTWSRGRSEERRVGKECRSGWS